MLWTDMYAANNNIYTNTNNTNGSLPSLQNFQPTLKQNIYQSPPQLHTEGNEEFQKSKSQRRASPKRKSPPAEDESSDEKRKNFLERNRQAALKCRQRKKQWLNSLQERIEFLANDNEQLQLQANIMRDEVRNLQNLLLMHKDCPMNNGNNAIVPPLSQQLMATPPPSNNLYKHAHKSDLIL